MEKNLDALINLGAKNILYVELEDYYGPMKTGLNTSIVENVTYDVGIVKAVGATIDKEIVDKVAFFVKGMGKSVNVNRIGKFKVIDSDFRLLSIMDQDINNYKQ